MSQTTINATASVDASLSYTDAVWATARDGASAEAVGTGGLGLVAEGSLDAGEYTIGRSGIVFDTSNIPNNATIVAVDVKLYVDSATNADSGGGNCGIAIDGDAGANLRPTPGGIIAGDYNRTHYGIGTVYSELTDAQISTGAYNTFTLDSNGKSQVDKTGNTTFIIIHRLDMTDTAPGGVNQYGVDGSGDPNPPQLAVTYAIPNARRGIKSVCNIAGNSVDVNDFKVTWEALGHTIVRTVNVVLPFRSYFTGKSLSRQSANFYHGICRTNPELNFEGSVINPQIDRDEVRLTLIDYTYDIASTEIAPDANVTGYTITQLVRQLCSDAGVFNMDTFTSQIHRTTDKVKPTLAKELLGRQGTDALNSALFAATRIKSWDEVIEYYFINARADVPRIIAIPELDASTKFIPSGDRIGLTSKIDYTDPITRCRMYSSDDSSVYSGNFQLTSVEEAYTKSPLVKQTFPSNSQDALHDAAYHFCLLRREPQAAFTVELVDGMSVRPMTALDLSALDIPETSAYVKKVEYDADMIARLDLSTRRPDIFDILGI